MILAAGLGKRMRPLTLTKPKPLIPVLDKPLIQYHIESLRSAGITQLAINHAWLGEQIEQEFGCGSSLGVEIRYSPEGEPLETGGGIYKALPIVAPEQKPFVIVNGDVFTDFPFEQLPQKIDGLAHLVMVNNPVQHPAGDFALEDDGKLAQQGVRKFTYSGIAVISPKLFARAPEGGFPLAPLLREAMDKGLVTGQLYDGLWVDVGTPQRLEQLEQDLVALEQ